MKKVKEKNEREKEKRGGGLQEWPMQKKKRKKSLNMILIPSNRDPHKSRSSCLAELYPIERREGAKRRGGGKGNNFPRSTWLRFIIYDLGNNPWRKE